MDSTFLERMEQILALYALPYDEHYPVVCFDERPCFLIGDAVAGLSMKAGTPARQHYAYEKFASCALLAAIEPLTGMRLGQVHQQRTKREYTQCRQAVAVQYPGPEAANHPLDGTEGLRRGIRVGIIARESEAEAWQVARRRFAPDRAGQLTHQLATKVSDSVWHRRLSAIELCAVHDRF